MNAPSTTDTMLRLEDFPYRLTDNVRYADLDPNQHVNNAVYATYFETGRVTLMKDRSYGLMPPGLAWIMVRLDIHFRAELRWPGTIELGLGLTKFGRTSVTFDQVDLHVEQTQFENGKQPAWARANDQHVGLDGFAHIASFRLNLARLVGCVSLPNRPAGGKP